MSPSNTPHRPNPEGSCTAAALNPAAVRARPPSRVNYHAHHVPRAPANHTQAYGSAGASSVVPGDVTATAVGQVYSLMDTGKNLTATDPAYGLHRAASLKLVAWEERGSTDGYVLWLLGGLGLLSDK